MSFSKTPSHRPASPPDFGSLVLPLLAERRQKNDPTVVREVERDPTRDTVQADPKLEKSVAQRTRRRETQTVAIRSEPFYGRHHGRELFHGEGLDPLLNFPGSTSTDHMISTMISTRLARPPEVDLWDRPRRHPYLR